MFIVFCLSSSIFCPSLAVSGVSLICFRDMIWLLCQFCESGCPLPSLDVGSLESFFLQISFLLLSFFILTFWDFHGAYINPLYGVPYVPRLSSLKKKFASPTIMDNFKWPIFEFADYFFSIIKSVVEHL